MPVPEQICATEKIAAFIDGELEVNESTAFEAHVVECESCNSELLAQRQFMCELDSALAGPFELDVPRSEERRVGKERRARGGPEQGGQGRATDRRRGH